MKNEKLRKYKEDIKRQMEEKEKQRNNERIKDKYATSYINLTLSEIEKRLCDSCEKTYPKKLMTKVKK